MIQSKVVLHQYGIHSSVVQREYANILDGKWVTSQDPCFDLVCKDDECISQSTKLTFKKRRKSGTDCNKNNCMIDHGLFGDIQEKGNGNKTRSKNRNDAKNISSLEIEFESPKSNVNSNVKVLSPTADEHSPLKTE